MSSFRPGVPQDGTASIHHQYFAMVPDNGLVTTLECPHHYTDSAPTPCREIFGSFLVPPTAER